MAEGNRVGTPQILGHAGLPVIVSPPVIADLLAQNISRVEDVESWQWSVDMCRPEPRKGDRDTKRSTVPDEHKVRNFIHSLVVLPS